MKGGLVAMLCAFLTQHRKNPEAWAGELMFAASFGEETGSSGARRMVDERQLDAFDAMIIAEPTSNELMIAHKGALWLRNEVIGEAGHSSMPHGRVNAIDVLRELQTELASLNLEAVGHDLLTPATAVVTQIGGGKGINVLPDSSWLTFDIRSLPSQSHTTIFSQIERIAEQVQSRFPGSQISVEKLVDLPAINAAPDAPIVEIFRDVLTQCHNTTKAPQGANYFTDGSVFTEIGGDIVVIGPGEISEAHRTDESIDISEFIRSISIYEDVISAYLV